MLLAVGLTFVPGPSVANAQDAPAPAQAAAAVSAEVIVLHATNDGSGIDPKIGKMAELGKPPFSSYNSYKLLDRSKMSIDKASPTKIKLPNDGVLMVSLKDVINPKKKDEQKRYVIGASIQKPGGNSFLPLLEVNAKAGETFFVAGQSHKGGILVIGIKVNP
ncbi:hypothetical protein E8A73_018150 [Polyangium aurulentum]|nr:hypothetical protein E8A73_018150 [Polyangium aurulentum]